jgi:hypothetical protein
MAEETYTDKQGNDVTLEELLKDRTEEQVKAIKFFKGIPINEGCFKKEYLSLDAYEKIISGKLGDSSLKEYALQKLGLDEDQVCEIEPVCFRGYRYAYTKLEPYTTGSDGRYVSSMYETTWLFFGDEQVYVYNHAFDTTDSTLFDTTSEYFYSDVTAFATRSDNVERKIWFLEGSGCSSERVSKSKSVNSELFRIVVPGEVFECAYDDDDDTTQKKVSAMKQKLREKKQK